MSGPLLSEKLYQLIGEVRAIRDTINLQAEQPSAAKTWLRWFKWCAGLVATGLAIFAAYKGVSR